MLISAIALFLGIWRYRFRAYWNWAFILLGWQIGAPLLFALDGTLENPTGDGLISHQIRIATQAGPGIGIFAIAFIVAYYGIIIFLIRQMRVAVRDWREVEEYDEEEASVGRKLAEVSALALVTCGFVYWQYAGLLNGPTVPTAAAADAHDPVASQLALMAQELTANGPQRVDAITTLEGATAEGRTLIYHYRLSRRDASDARLIATIRRKTVPQVCGNRQMRDEIDNYGITYRYSYMLPRNAEPVSVDVDANACADIG